VSPYDPTELISIRNHNFRGPVSDVRVEDCILFSVEDTSNWTIDDWNNKSANGISSDGERVVVRSNTLRNVNFGISMSGPHALVEHNLVENFAGDGMRGLGDYDVFQYNTVKNCYDVNANHDDGFQSWSVGQDGVGTGEVVGVELRGNTIINYEDPNQPFRGTLQGIGCFDGMFVDWVVENNLILVDHWHGITLLGARGCRIVNNTVLDLNNEDPGPPWIRIGNDKDGTPPEDCVVRNNLATAFNSEDSSGVTSDHNLTITDATALFVDPPNFDFHLKPGTEAIDTGSSDLAPAQDKDGVPRPQGDAVDLGCYEYHEGPIVYPDGGVSDDGGGSGDGSVNPPNDGGIDAGSVDGNPTKKSGSSSGCGCHTSGIPDPTAPLWITVLLGMLFVRRRSSFHR